MLDENDPYVFEYKFFISGTIESPSDGSPMTFKQHLPHDITKNKPVINALTATSRSLDLAGKF